MKMNKPSSTITAAALAGMGMTLFWQSVMYFQLMPAPPPSMVAASVTFVASAVGYYKKENVLK
jgi:divalent metal cation (Fe/Co/Zn/Cd) transporter